MYNFIHYIYGRQEYSTENLKEGQNLVEIMSAVIIVLILINIFLVMRLNRHKGSQTELDIINKLGYIENSLSRTEESIRLELARSREEMNKNARESREELNKAISHFGQHQLNRMSEIAQMQKNQLDTFSNQLVALTGSNEQRLEQMRMTIEQKLKDLQEDNSQKLEKMRQTVDEKLHKTLEERIGQSFKMVSERLEQVYKGLGEMQTLATGVGDLKKVLSNVKTRGILGEIQLGNILEQILTPDQYEQNISTKSGTREVVEFAIKLPGKESPEDHVYLPVDSKFPLEVYHLLLEAYDKADISGIEEAAKHLETCIKKCAKDIRDKYLEPPNTTDFGIMFLPIEGLYAEVVRRTGLIEILQRDYRIIITGPTTLAAFLNSLQMGFRTLAIEKRSSEVWKVLGAVKTEFDKFGVVLSKAQEKIRQADKEIEDLVGARTRQIQRKLKDVHEVPSIAQEPDLLNAGE